MNRPNPGILRPVFRADPYFESVGDAARFGEDEWTSAMQPTTIPRRLAQTVIVFFATWRCTEMASSEKLRPAILLAWKEAALCYLAERGTNEDSYRLLIRKRMLEAVAFVHTRVLLSCAEQQGLKAKDFSDKLGVDKSTYSRWWNEAHPPKLELFLGAANFVLRRQLEAFSFPSVKHATWHAVSRTLAQIRKEECGEAGDALPRVEEIACVARCLADPRSESLLEENENKGGNNESRDTLRLLSRVLAQHRERYPQGQIASVQDMQRVLRQWGIPYALLQTGWEACDETAV